MPNTHSPLCMRIPSPCVRALECPLYYSADQVSDPNQMGQTSIEVE